MSRMLVRDKIVESHTINVVRKGALYAAVCDACGTCYEPAPDSGAKNHVGLIFDRTYYETSDGERRSMGNTATFDACSASCAARIIDGKWREAGTGVKFAAVEAKILRSGCKIGPVILAEQLVDAWYGKPLLSIPETLDLPLRYSSAASGAHGPVGLVGATGEEPLV